MRCWVVIMAIGVMMSDLSESTTLGGEIDFREDFSLAPDRSVPLKQLIPGTEDYYYYHALHAQNQEEFDKVDALLVPWVQRHGETARVWEIRTRQALLTYHKNPQNSLDYVRGRINLQFPHQKEILGAEPNLPTELDPRLISRETLFQRAAPHTSHLNSFEDTALEWLVFEKLNPERRRNLLSRLTRPDYPGLVKLIIDDLNHEHSPGFGAFTIHRHLTLAQLDEALKLKPDLLNQGNFVQTYLTKLQPGVDEDWQHDPQLMQAYLTRLWTFVKQLSPVHNSLKTHVLYHQLLLDRQRGVYDKERFVSYLQLPRHLHYVSPRLLEREESRRFPVDLNANYTQFTLLPVVGNDEPLVRSYLSFYFVTATGYKEFEPYIHDIYLKHLFAETKVLHGLGETEQWASLLPPELFQQLKERVDIDFAFTNQTSYKADEPVKLDLHVKNVSTLIVKVFEINTKNYYRQNLREVDTDMNLDGLVANEEQTFTYPEPSLRRVTRRFTFPKLNKAGVYIIDFIGNGRSSRALIRKGKLRHVVRTGPAGQTFYVLDEQNRTLTNATVWLAGHAYQAPDDSQDGAITVPFSTAPGRQPIVLSQGDFASLDHFQHEAENYALTAGIYVDRESLLTRKKAQVLVRPGLYLNGTPISLKLLEEVRLQITSVDHDGVPTSQEVANFKLFEDRESVHEFTVPARLAHLSFALKAKVKNLSAGGQKVPLVTGETFALNDIDKTDKVEDLHLLKTSQGYVLEVLGKTGEPKVSRPVPFVFKHRDFRDPVHVSLKTDPTGRITLGPLVDIVTITATGPQNTAHTWTLSTDQHTYSRTLHGRVGEVLSLPYLGRAKELSRSELSLLELRGDNYVADRFEHLSLKNGLLLLSKLPQGDYDLLLKATGTQLRVRIVAGEKRSGYVLGQRRQLETQPLPPVQIESVTPDADKLTIRMQNVTPFARVHLFATRYQPAYHAYTHLSRVRSAEPYVFVPGHAESVYLTGRNIGDEYRYIIDRKYAKKFPGNSLERPSLLLNPWAVRPTETGEQIAQGGDMFAPKSPATEGQAGRGHGAGAGPVGITGNFWNLDFLAESTAVALNLIPDDQGIITIPRMGLGAHQHLHIVAIDPLHTTYRSLALPEPKVTFIDLRLRTGLDPKLHFTQQKQISVVPAGQPFVLADITSSRFEAYDQLARVYALYTTLTHDPKLAEFSFVVNWPRLKPEEQRALYSKYASHELTFFLAKKDPAFFEKTIRPYLANKKDKTFLDRWLLGDDLRDHLLPWKYSQLNTAERVLLSQRIPGERAHTARHIGDTLALLPPNIDRYISLFDTAVKGSALEAQDAFGFAEQAAKEKPADMLRMEQLEMRNAPRPTTAAGAMAPPPGMAAPAAQPGEFKRELKQAEKALGDMPAKDGKARQQLAAGKKAADDRLREADKSGDVSFFDAGKRDAQRQFYRKLDKTMEWAENNYHHLTIDQQHAGLIPPSPFWKDYAQHDPAQPYFSRNLAEAARNFPEMLLALAVLDLPFEAQKHDTRYEGIKMTLTPGSPMVIYHEEVKPAKPAANPVPILVSQNFYRHGDRFRQENGEQVDKYVTEEFVIHTVYGCQVVVTNPTSAQQKLSVLLQIPQGAIPVLNGQSTRTVFITLAPYHTQTIDYHFYFPAPGKYAHFPVHVAKNEQLLTFAQPFTFNVVDKPTKIDTQSWDYVSQHGSEDEVLNVLRTQNPLSLNLDKIAFRMRDPRFFERTIDLLARRHIYHHTLWSYSLLHNAVPAIREFLQHVDPIINEAGGRLSSPLLTIDPVARRTFEHLEYKPLVNARAHSLGKRRQIVNNRFSEQYHRFLKQLTYQRQLTDDDLLAVTYYLLLQDRIEEALTTFGRVNADKLATRMQYDYFTAYLDFFTGDIKEARAIATRYANHPVDRWRNTFNTILAQLDEVEGKGAKTVDVEDRSQQQTQLAATEPNFDFQVEARQIVINHQNLDSVRVNYYLMDVELLFSRNPFVQQFSGQFSSIRPNQTALVNLKPAAAPAQGQPLPAGTTKIPLPEVLHNRNVLVEITGAGQTKTQAYYSHSLSLQVIENYGQIRVTHAPTGKPVAKAYVKVYAQMQNGSVRFYKDGYTDLRGRFDYASLNTNDLDVAQKFSLLILSDDHGAVVKEALPPKR